jgi:hypothetical protein
MEIVGCREGERNMLEGVLSECRCEEKKRRRIS